jgi:hypothetical protein
MAVFSLAIDQWPLKTMHICYYSSEYNVIKNIVTYRPTAKQRLDEHVLGKHNPEVTLSIIEGHPVLGNGAVNRLRQKYKLCFLCCVIRAATI